MLCHQHSRAMCCSAMPASCPSNGAPLTRLQNHCSFNRLEGCLYRYLDGRLTHHLLQCLQRRTRCPARHLIEQPPKVSLGTSPFRFFLRKPFAISSVRLPKPFGAESGPIQGHRKMQVSPPLSERQHRSWLGMAAAFGRRCQAHRRTFPAARFCGALEQQSQ